MSSFRVGSTPGQGNQIHQLAKVSSQPKVKEQNLKIENVEIQQRPRAQSNQLGEGQIVQNAIQKIDPLMTAPKYKSWSKVKKTGNMGMQLVSAVLSLGIAKVKYSRSTQSLEIKLKMWGLVNKNTSNKRAELDRQRQKMSNQPIQKVVQNIQSDLPTRGRGMTNVEGEGKSDRKESISQLPKQGMFSQMNNDFLVGQKFMVDDFIDEMAGIKHETPDGSTPMGDEPIEQNKSIVEDKLEHGYQRSTELELQRNPSILENENPVETQKPKPQLGDVLKKDLELMDIVMDDIVGNIETGGRDVLDLEVDKKEVSVPLRDDKMLPVDLQQGISPNFITKFLDSNKTLTAMDEKVKTWDSGKVKAVKKIFDENPDLFSGFSMQVKSLFENVLDDFG